MADEEQPTIVQQAAIKLVLDSKDFNRAWKEAEDLIDKAATTASSVETAYESIAQSVLQLAKKYGASIDSVISELGKKLAAANAGTYQDLIGIRRAVMALNQDVTTSQQGVVQALAEAAAAQDNSARATTGRTLAEEQLNKILLVQEQRLKEIASVSGKMSVASQAAELEGYTAARLKDKFGATIQQASGLTGRPLSYEPEDVMRLSAALNASHAALTRQVQAVRAAREDMTALNVGQTVARENTILWSHSIELLNEHITNATKAMNELESKGDWRGARRIQNDIEGLNKRLAELKKNLLDFRVDAITAISDVPLSPSLIGTTNQQKIQQAAMNALASKWGYPSSALALASGGAPRSGAAEFGVAVEKMVRNAAIAAGARMDEFSRKIVGDIAGVPISGEADRVTNELVIDFKAINDTTADTLRKYSQGLLKLEDIVDQQALEYIYQLETYRRVLKAQGKNVTAQIQRFKGFGTTDVAGNVITPEMAVSMGAESINLPNMQDVTYLSRLRAAQNARAQAAASDEVLRRMDSVLSITNEEVAANERIRLAEKEIVADKAREEQLTKNAAAATQQEAVSTEEVARAREQVKAAVETEGALGKTRIATTLEELQLIQQELRLRVAAQQALVGKKEIAVIGGEGDLATTRRAAQAAKNVTIYASDIEREKAIKATEKAAREAKTKLDLEKESLKVAKLHLGSLQSQSKELAAMVGQVRLRNQEMQRQDALSAETLSRVEASRARIEGILGQVRAKELTKTDARNQIREEISWIDQEIAKLQDSKRVAKERADNAVIQYQRAAAAAEAAREQQAQVMFGLGRSTTTTQAEQAVQATTTAELLVNQTEAHRHAVNADVVAIDAQTNALRTSKAQLQQTANQMSNMEGRTKSWTDRLFSLRKVATVFFGSILSMLVYGAIGNIQQFFTDTSKKAQELEQQIVELALAVRTSQRALGDGAGSLQQWNSLIDQLSKKFGVFSTTDLRKAAIAIQDVAREYGMTFEQMQTSMEDALVISLLDPSKSVDEWAATVARGSEEAVRALNKVIGKIDTTTRDEMALKLGYAGAYEALTEYDQRLVNHAIIHERVQRRQQDLGLVLNTTTTNIRKQQADWDNVTAKMGTSWQGFVLVWMSTTTKLLEAMMSFSDMVGKIFNNLLRTTKTFGEVFGGLMLTPVVFLQAFINMTKGMHIKDAFKDAIAQTDELYKSMKKVQDLKDAPELAEPFDKSKFQQDQETGAKKAATRKDILDLVEMRLKAAEKEAEDEVGLEKKKVADLLEVDQKYTEDAEKLRQGVVEKIKEDDAKEAKAIANARKKAADDIAKAIANYDKAIFGAKRDFDRKEADAALDLQRDLEDIRKRAQEKDAKDTKDHLKRLRDLQRQFLDDIEEAVRERDARKVLDILKRFNRDKQKEAENAAEKRAKNAEDLAREIAQRQEKYAIDKARRLEDYNHQLLELRENLDERKKEIRESLKQELADIKEAGEERRKELWDQYRKDLIDLMTAAGRRRDEINARYRQELADLKRSNDEQAREQARGWAEKYKLTTESANAIAAYIERVLGPGSRADQILKGFTAARELEQKLAAMPNPYAPPRSGETQEARTYTTFPGESLNSVAAKYAVSASNLQLANQRPDGSYWGLGTPLTPGTVLNIPRFAKGTAFITNGPIVGMFGEGMERELVTATPMSKLNANSLQGVGPGGLSGPLRFEFDVRADDTFSLDFEDRLIGKIAGVVREVVPVRGRR